MPAATWRRRSSPNRPTRSRTCASSISSPRIPRGRPSPFGDRRPAERDLPRLAVRAAGRRRRAAPAPGELVRRLPEPDRDRARRRPTGGDPHDRGLDPGRPVDRAPGPAPCRRLPRGARRVQPARPAGLARASQGLARPSRRRLGGARTRASAACAAASPPRAPPRTPRRPARTAVRRSMGRQAGGGQHDAVGAAVASGGGRGGHGRAARARELIHERRQPHARAEPRAPSASPPRARRSRCRPRTRPASAARRASPRRAAGRPPGSARRRRTAATCPRRRSRRIAHGALRRGSRSPAPGPPGRPTPPA